MDDFKNVSRSFDGIKFTKKKVTLALDELKQELAKREAQMTVLGDVHSNIEQDMERLNS